MINKLLFGFILFLVFSVSVAQTYNSTNGARAIGMAGTAVLLRDIWAIQNNIAGIAKLENTEISAYFKNSYGMGGLNYGSFALAKPLKNGSLGFSFDRAGNNNLNEQRIGLGYAHNIDNISLGTKISLLQVTVKDLGVKTVAAFEFGGIVNLNEQLVFGAHIYNFSKAKVADYVDERFSTVMKAGISYQPYEKLIINVETEKNIEYDADLKVGLEYFVVENIAFRTGFATLTNSAYFGLGLKSKTTYFDYALSHHSYLGFSNHISLTYLLRNNEKK